MIRTRILHYLVCGLACLAMTTPAWAIAVDANMRQIIPKTLASDIGTLAAFDYDAATETFYVGVFGGDAGFRTITNTGSGWTGVWNSEYASSTSTVLRFMRSTDVTGGVTSASNTGSSFMGGILLNPAPLTIEVPVADVNGLPTSNGSGGYLTTPVTYGAGQLAYILDGATTVNANSYANTKFMYRWDLRTVGATGPTTDPDFANAQRGDVDEGGLPIVTGALDKVDWNDMLSVVFTEQDFRDTAAAGGASAPGTDNLMRQQAWSTDGQSLYFAEKSKYQGGIYKVDACTGDLDWIYHENQDSHPNADSALVGGGIKSEPAVLSTAVCDFSDGQFTGDQIIFGGTLANGNYGGLNYITTNASGTSSLQVLVDASEFRAWAENDSFAADETTAVDSQGNVYFYGVDSDSAVGVNSGGLYMRDTQGRFACLLNVAELYELNYSLDGERSGYTFLRAKTYEDANGVHVLFRGDNAYIGEVDVNTIGDLTGDDVIDTADCSFMIEQYKKSCYGTVPTVPVDGQEVFLDYLLADMNGSSAPLAKGTGTLVYAGVTFKDVEILAQYVTGGLLMGDLNWDGVAADTADWAIFDANYGLAPATGVWSWFDGDMDHDGDVDDADRAMMSPSIAGDANRDGKVDGSDVTILAGNWQVLSGATWEMGDFNGDGKVDGSDVTILAGNWQAGVTAAASAVPEPSTIILILLGLATLVIRRVNR